MKIIAFLKHLTMFRNTNRINRVQWLTYFGLLTIVGAMLLKTLDISPPNHFIHQAAVFLFGLLITANLILLTIKRLYDTDDSSMWVLLSIFSWLHICLVILNIIPSLFILVTPGTEGDNKFGPQPIKAKKFEYVLATIFLPICLAFLIICMPYICMMFVFSALNFWPLSYLFWSL